MNNSESSTERAISWFVWPTLALLFLLVIWLHHQFLLIDKNYANRDFMSLWTGGRALLEGLNPHDESVWRPLRLANGSTWVRDPIAPFPLWTFFFTWPLAMLPIPIAAAIWLTIQETLLLMSGIVVIGRMANRLLTLPLFTLFLLVAFLARPTLVALDTGQMTFLLLASLVLFIYFVERGQSVYAGIMMSLMAIKPNPFIALAPILLLWLLWRRQWQVLGGAALTGIVLFAASILIQPGWLAQWLNVRSKAEVVTWTPTFWGLATELAGSWWAPTGLVLVTLIMFAIGYYLFTRPYLSAGAVVSIGLATSLLVTPYTWSYEHALLLLPSLMFLAFAPTTSLRIGLWLFLAGLLPWATYSLALIRSSDSLGFITPLLTLAVILYACERQWPGWRRSNINHV